MFALAVATQEELQREEALSNEAPAGVVPMPRYRSNLPEKFRRWTEVNLNRIIEGMCTDVVIAFRLANDEFTVCKIVRVQGLHRWEHYGEL